MADGVVDEGKDLGISRGEIAESNQFLTSRLEHSVLSDYTGCHHRTIACAVYDDDSAFADGGVGSGSGSMGVSKVQAVRLWSHFGYRHVQSDAVSKINWSRVLDSWEKDALLAWLIGAVAMLR